MRAEHQTLAAFYATRQGAVAARLIQQRLDALWPTLAGQAVLGVGHALPYLAAWRPGAGRCVALSPAQLGVRRWPERAANLACVCDEESFPFPDLTFDRVLLMHGLEGAENPRRLLREAWRVLRDDGRLLVVAANRRGLWAHVESTPFGQGQPFSAGQLGRLLTTCLFRPERRDSALFMPPVSAGPVLRSADIVERLGRTWAPSLAGVTLCEATKEMWAAIPAVAVRARRAAVRRRVLVADTA